MKEIWVWSLGWEDPWKRKWQTPLVFLPGKPHGQRSLAGCNLWGYKELDTTWWLSTDREVFVLQHKQQILPSAGHAAKCWGLWAPPWPGDHREVNMEKEEMCRMDGIETGCVSWAGRAGKEGKNLPDLEPRDKRAGIQGAWQGGERECGVWEVETAGGWGDSRNTGTRGPAVLCWTDSGGVPVETNTAGK